VSYGAAAAAADDDDYNKNNKLLENEHKELIRKSGTINLILY